MVDNNAAYFSVNMNSCFSVDGDCVHSNDSLGWSPHNVLFVATHRALYLHINELVAANAVIHPNFVFCCEKYSQMCITGAKWALDLVPEEMYPATCRLCVRTTRDIFVYRVMRYGSGRLRVSNGICFIPKQAPVSEVDASAAGSKKKGSELINPPDCNVATTTTEANDNAKMGRGNLFRLSLVSYEWFPCDLLVLVTSSNIYLINMWGNTSDEEASQQCSFPAPAFCFLNSTVAGLSASCATRVLGCGVDNMRLIVACPYYLCIFYISTSTVSLGHYVEVPLLCSIPTAVCGFADNANDSTLRVFLSAPMSVIQGTFAGCAPGGGGLAVVSAQRAEWTTTELWTTKSDLHDEIAVSRFLTISLESFLRLDAEATAKLDAGATLVTTPNCPFLVLGLCRRRLLGFVGKRCVELIRCFRIDAGAPPVGFAHELSGVAVHRSCSLAVLGLRFAARYYPPFQLFPVSLGDAGGFLSRFLQLHEGFGDITEENSGFSLPSPVSSTNTPATMGKLTATVLAKTNNIYFNLWNRQQSTSYFIWEELLPKCAFAAVFTQSCQNTQETRKAVKIPPLLKEEKSIAELMPSAPLHSYSILFDFRQRYLDLRQKYGVELFLRFPVADAEWRRILLSIFRRCSGDVALQELLLANAVQQMAEKINYAGFTRSGRVLMKTTSPSRSVLDADCSVCLTFLAALRYGELYHEQCMECNGWVYTLKFAETLGRFIDTVKTEWMKMQEQEGRKWKLDELPKFPCSICGKEEQVLLNMSLFSFSHVMDYESTKVDVPDCVNGFHITTFSGSTFASLFFVTEDKVLSRCNSCGLYDYATGPFCCVCEGLLM